MELPIAPSDRARPPRAWRAGAFVLSFVVAWLATGCLGIHQVQKTPPGDDVKRSHGATPVFSSSLFRFYSDPEINLHHFLFRWATAQSAQRSGSTGLAVEAEDLAIAVELEGAEAEAWSAAVDFYEKQLIGRTLVFDDGLVAIRDVLSGKLDRHAVLDADREVFDHLARCLPIYRQHWWPRHDESNRRWIAEVEPLLARHERRVAQRIVDALETPWPSPPNRVDVTAYANRTSAYSTSEPHTTIASLDSRNSMPWGFELLFHEQSHSAALSGALRDTVDAAFAELGQKPPRNLWHILLFATTGECTRLTRVEAGDPDYLPYAEKHQVFRRRPADRRAWAAIDAHWIPALRHGKPLSAAIHRVVEELVTPAESGSGGEHLTEPPLRHPAPTARPTTPSAVTIRSAGKPTFWRGLRWCGREESNPQPSDP